MIHDMICIICYVWCIIYFQLIYSTAETMYKQALEIMENAYGPDHPSVAKVS